MPIKVYYHLTKPGLVRGNLLAAVAGFFFGSLGGPLELVRLLALVVGLGCVMGGGCALNNYADRGMDAKMERTKKRALPAGLLRERQVVMFGLMLSGIGAAILFFFTTPLAFLSGVVGWVCYVLLYTPLKPRTKYALFVGAIAGAMPPVAGYAAAAGTVDVYAAFLFVAMFLWQIPHFLAIAYFRFSDYHAAGVPLFVREQPSQKATAAAKKAFRYSLVVLLLACLFLIVQRWIR